MSLSTNKWDLKYFLGLETFIFWMEIPSLEAWSLTTVTNFIGLAQCSLCLRLWASLTVQYVLQSVSLPQNIQAWRPNSKARIKQLSSSCYFIRFNDLQEPPKEVNAFLLPLKWSQPRLKSFPVLCSMASTLKTLAWPPDLLHPWMSIQHGTWWAWSRTVESVFLLQGCGVWKPW